MKRFIITSNKFTGQAEIIYNGHGYLCVIDFRNAKLSPGQLRFLKSQMPDIIQDLETFSKESPSLTIVEADFEVTFEMFWLKYNKKINKKRGIQLWNKMSKTKQVKAFYGITQYDKFLSKEDWRTKADPETYLRNEMFDNEWS